LLEAFHPDTRRMLAAAHRLRSHADPENVEQLEPLLPRLFTGRALEGALTLDTCGREVARLLGTAMHGRDLFARFPSVDRGALQALLLQARLCQTTSVARVSARLSHDRAIECELALAPLLRRADGSEAVLGLFQPVQAALIQSPALELRLLAVYPVEGQSGPRTPRLVASTPQRNDGV
jgi:hypothetical protein